MSTDCLSCASFYFMRTSAEWSVSFLVQFLLIILCLSNRDISSCLLLSGRYCPGGSSDYMICAFMAECQLSLTSTPIFVFVCSNLLGRRSCVLLRFVAVSVCSDLFFFQSRFLCPYSLFSCFCPSDRALILCLWIFIFLSITCCRSWRTPGSSRRDGGWSTLLFLIVCRRVLCSLILSILSSNKGWLMSSSNKMTYVDYFGFASLFPVLFGC